MNLKVHGILVMHAEADYECALNRLRALGVEPNLHRMPESVAPLLNVLQSGIEATEGFPLDSHTMAMMVGTINSVRIEIGYDVIPTPIGPEKF